MESLVETYGYLAILIGTFLEGETILVLGGLAAHQGYLALPWVILAAFGGSLCGDQLFFLLGRRHSQFILNRRPSWRARIDKAQKLMDRFQTPLILVFRFLYGLRTVMPFIIGMSRVPTYQFVALNAAGALVWAVIVGAGGYAFGHAIQIIIGDLKHYEFVLFTAIAAIGLLVWVVYFKQRWRKNNLIFLKLTREHHRYNKTTSTGASEQGGFLFEPHGCRSYHGYAIGDGVKR